MTNLQRIQVRQSEIREAINSLLGKSDRSDAENAELRQLTDEGTKLETEYRAATVADGSDPEIREVIETDDSETREARALRGKSSISAFLHSAISGDPLEGPDAEFRSACNVRAGHMPVDLLMDAPGPEEHRAVTPGTALPGTTATVAPMLFERTAAGSLGVGFPVVQQGEARYPILTTAPTASRLAKSAEAPATAGAFRLDTRKPGRISGAFEVRVEDLATMGPAMNASLRQSITEVVGQGVDEAVFNGAATDPNADDAIQGLYQQATDVTAATAVETFASGIKRYADLVDGQYAYSPRDVRTVIGSATYSLYASLLHSGSGESLYVYLSGRLGSVRVTDRVPAMDATSKAQKNLVALTGGRQPIRVPIWRGLQLITDQVSQARKGIVTVTAILLLGSPHLPYQTNTIKEVHPKLEA